MVEDFIPGLRLAGRNVLFHAVEKALQAPTRQALSLSLHPSGEDESGPEETLQGWRRKAESLGELGALCF